MKLTINIIILGTKDLERATHFYAIRLCFPKINFKDDISFLSFKEHGFPFINGNSYKLS